ncbi:hypothetical protein M9Y10_005171 [Tritrichomonas musculus]|uniref:Uncharacterized protein n=1 Tax=Tritrichomonas musculus TaxID=1915356 RepID=A0ABR2JKX7_9EUKA
MKANMSHDIEKEIHYFTLAANKNELQALFYLGSIRYESQYNTFNTNKAINLFTHTKNQTNTIFTILSVGHFHKKFNEQLNLDIAYYEGEFNT